jgi:ParB/RepB/Spo0J family partition protein
MNMKTPTAASRPDADSAPILVPLAQLLDSPFNSRVRYAGLEELAENIKSEGRIHQALLARPSPAGSGLQLVFGHRRKRAAALAGLMAVPVVVRSMTDAEVRSAQAAENLQRENITALEEAQSYADMVAHDGLAKDQVAARVGRSRAHVYGRLQLLASTAVVRDALASGAVGSEVALLLARLRTEALQLKALAAIRGKGLTLEDGGKMSTRRIQAMLAEDFTLELRGALFDPEDPTLVTAAGVCSTCPKRSGNAPEFQDLADKRSDAHHGGPLLYGTPCGPDLCTDPDCWGEKKAAHLNRAAEALRRTGKAVVTGNAARQAIGARGEVKGSTYVALADVKMQLKGKTMPVATVAIQDPRTGKVVQAVKRSELQAAGVQGQLDVTQPSAAHGRDWAAERAQQQAAADAERTRRQGLVAAIRSRVPATPGSTGDLRIIARSFFDLLDCDKAAEVVERMGSALADFESDLDHLGADQLRVLLLDMALAHVADVEGWDITRNRDTVDLAATVYGLAPVPTSTPSPAAQAGDKAEAAQAAGKGEGKGKGTAKPARGVRYSCAATGATWSGKGLMPAWLKAALASGKVLADFEVNPTAKPGQKVKAGAAGSDAQASLPLADEVGA